MILLYSSTSRVAGAVTLSYYYIYVQKLSHITCLVCNSRKLLETGEQTTKQPSTVFFCSFSVAVLHTKLRSDRFRRSMASIRSAGWPAVGRTGPLLASRIRNNGHLSACRRLGEGSWRSHAWAVVNAFADAGTGRPIEAPRCAFDAGRSAATRKVRLAGGRGPVATRLALAAGRRRRWC